MRTRQRLEQIHLHPEFALAQRIVARLRPHQTLVAGGSVRDALLDRRPKDLDLATAAEPARVEAAFTRTIDVGRAFGTIVVVEDGRTIEVTTFRREEVYLDKRRPSGVTFTDAAEDARRRDFTVNALFYDVDAEEVIDYVGGVADLNARRLVTVGPAHARFTEDSLRMLRAVRFVAQLGFDLDSAAARAITELKEDLRRVAGERVLAEMKRLLEAPGRAAGLRLARRLGVLDIIWPGCAVDAPAGEFLNWQNAFANHAHAAGPAAARACLTLWRASREDQRRIAEQLRFLDILGDPNATLAARVRALGSQVGAEVGALARARGIDFAQARARLADLGGHLPTPLLDGADLQRQGFAPGRALGQLLDQVYDAQLEGRINSRDDAERWVRAARP